MMTSTFEEFWAVISVSNRLYHISAMKKKRTQRQDELYDPTISRSRPTPLMLINTCTSSSPCPGYSEIGGVYQDGIHRREPQNPVQTTRSF
jgi:hypothetical protein